MKKITPEMYVRFRRMLSHRNITSDINTLCDFIIQSGDDALIDELYCTCRDYCESIASIAKKLIDYGNKETEN